MAAADPAAAQARHLLHPRTAAEQLAVIFAGDEPADDGRIAALAEQLLAEHGQLLAELAQLRAGHAGA